MKALKEYNVKNLIIAGGVSANSGIRNKFNKYRKNNKNLEQDNVGVVLLNDSSDIKEGDIVRCTHHIASINVASSKIDDTA